MSEPVGVEAAKRAAEILQNRIKNTVAEADKIGKVYRLDTKQVAQRIIDLISYHNCELEGKYILTREEAISLLEQLILNPQIEQFELKVQRENIFIKDLTEE